MSKNTKIALIVVGILALICAIACAVVGISGYFAAQQVGTSLITNPAQADEKGHTIVDYQIPSDFTEASGMSLLGMDMVMYMDPKGGMGIFIMQMPAGTDVDPDAMQQQLQSSASSQNTQLENVEQVGTQDVTINGETVTLIIQEGTTETDNVKTRQMIGVFTGKNGNPAFLMIMGPVKSWDNEMIDSFLDSMK